MTELNSYNIPALEGKELRKLHEAFAVEFERLINKYFAKGFVLVSGQEIIVVPQVPGYDALAPLAFGLDVGWGNMSDSGHYLKPYNEEDYTNIW